MVYGFDLEASFPHPPRPTSSTSASWVVALLKVFSLIGLFLRKTQTLVCQHVAFLARERIPAPGAVAHDCTVETTQGKTMRSAMPAFELSTDLRHQTAPTFGVQAGTSPASPKTLV